MEYIEQGHLSGSISSFDFVNHLKLKKDINFNKPIIIFGVYNGIDKEIIKKCKSHITIFWGGQDANNNNRQIPLDFIKTHKSIRHITCLNKIPLKLEKIGIDCEIIPPMRSFYEWNNFYPVLKKDKIFSYLPQHNRKKMKIHNLYSYYGGDIINRLGISNGILGVDPAITGEVDIKKWKNLVGITFYEKCFMGLGLSPFGGGGGGVIEMGLCGLKVVSNVINGPHVLKWSNEKEITQHITNERDTIGTKDITLREEVLEYLVSDSEWLKV